MPFPELLLREAPAPAAGLSARADVALFVGLVPRRARPLPRAIRAALEAAGWAGAGSFARTDAQVEALLDMPVAVEGWGAFEELFAWDERAVAAGDPRRVPCALGLAVRSFFAAGGVRAWVVRCGDPLPLLRAGNLAAIAGANRRLLAWAPAAPPANAAQRVPLVGGLNGLGTEPDPTAPETWRGVAHAWGVEEAAMLLLPDLPELAGGVPQPLPAPPGPPPVPEAFRPCAPPVPGSAPPEQATRLAFTAPRLDRNGYRLWSQALAQVLRMLATPRGAAHRRDVTLLSSLPLPQSARDAAPQDAEAWPLALLDEAGIPAPGIRLRDAAGLGSARLQLGYPWVETTASIALPEGAEAPEGVLAGTIAASSLRLGAFRSAAGTRLPAVHRTLPELGTGAMRRGLPDHDAADWLGARLSLVTRRVDGFALLSDATMSADAARRPGGVARLMGILLRAARTLGQQRIFDNSGPALWAELRLELEALLEKLRAAGALDGATPAEAYTVRCDRSTMTQADLDNGRVVATVAFQPAYPVERITVTLALAEAGLALRGEGGLMPIPVPQGQDASTPLPGFNFHVHFAAGGGGAFPPFADLDTSLTGGFSEVSGLEASMEAKAVKVGGRNHGAIQLPGPVSFATVVLKRGLVESRHLWRWWALFTGADGAPNGDWRAQNRCTVTIAMLRGRDPVLGWKLIRAMPIKFRAGDLSARATDVAIEELHLVHEGLRMEPMA